jgi:riboflavin synthase alpha subunit
MFRKIVERLARVKLARSRLTRVTAVPRVRKARTVRERTHIGPSIAVGRP